MATTSTHPEHSRVMRAYTAVDSGAERVLGVDTRLLYGFAVPVLAIVGVIIGFSFHARWWLVGIVVAFEVLALVIVVLGFVHMLGQGDEPDDLVS